MTDRHRADDGRQGSVLLELGLVVAIFVLANIAFALTQPRIDVAGGRGFDGVQYDAVANQLAAGIRPVAEAPFVYRIGTPLLASLFGAGDTLRGFIIVNLVANLALTLLFAAILRRYVSDIRVRLALALAFVFAWHGPVRFVWFYPVAAEHVPYAANLAILLGGTSLGMSVRAASLLWLTAVAFVGTLARETALLAPGALLFVRDPLRRAVPSPVQVMLAIPLVAGLAAFAIAHALGTQTNSYGYLSALVDWLRLKSIFAYVLGWWNAYGPVLALPVVAWRESWRFLRSHQMLAMFLLACAALGWVGGQDTERYVFWAAPVVYTLIGRALISWLLMVPAALVGAVALAQVLAERVIGIVPQPAVLDPIVQLQPDRPLPSDLVYVLTPLGNADYFDLWSFWMSRAAKTILLAEYGVVFVAVAGATLLFSRRAGASPRASPA